MTQNGRHKATAKWSWCIVGFKHRGAISKWTNGTNCVLSHSQISLNLGYLVDLAPFFNEKLTANVLYKWCSVTLFLSKCKAWRRFPSLFLLWRKRSATSSVISLSVAIPLCLNGVLFSMIVSYFILFLKLIESSAVLTNTFYGFILINTT